MDRRWHGLVALGLGVVMLGGGALGASAFGSSSLPRATHLADRSGRGDDGAAVRPGTLDDGRELLPQARISLDQAIAAARAVARGDVGEVDLEQFQGRLVFNVDVGDRDVKVDASDGSILSTTSTD